MKNIWIKPYNNVRYQNNFFKLDKHINPFYGLDKTLIKYGINVQILKPDCNWIPGETIVCADIPYPWEINYWQKLLLNKRNNNILFCFDSPLVVPFNHWKANAQLFSKIYTYNDDLVDGKNFMKLYLPQIKPQKPPLSKNYDKKKLLVMINSKKSSLKPFLWLSPYKEDYYSERLKIIDFLNQKYPNDFDLYGPNWDCPDRFSLKERLTGFKRYKVYKGIVDNKLETLSNYKFCIAFENTAVSGYITEKIFDCFWANVVPIYLGSPNIEKYISKDCYIDFRNFDSNHELVEFLKNVNYDRYKKYLSAINNFINSKLVDNLWFNNAFVNKLVEAVRIK